MDWRVLVGAVPPVGVAAAKSEAQVEVAPVELTQEERMSARVLSSAWGTVPLPAGVVARGVPVVVLTRFGTDRKALERPRELVLLAPTWGVPGVMNGARAWTKATVVARLMRMK